MSSLSDRTSVWVILMVVLGCYSVFAHFYDNGNPDFFIPQAVLKCLLVPMCTLLYFTYVSRPFSPKDWSWLVLAHVCGTIGDGLLLSTRTVATGGLFFLAGHCFYTVAFWTRGGRLRKSVSVFVVPILVLAVLGGVFAVIYTQNTGLDVTTIAMIVGYGLFLLYMVVSALYLPLRRHSGSSLLPWNLVGVGAVLFMVSDCCLALRAFISLPLYTHLVVMWTYTIGQALISVGLGMGDRVVSQATKKLAVGKLQNDIQNSTSELCESTVESKK